MPINQCALYIYVYSTSIKSRHRCKDNMTGLTRLIGFFIAGVTCSKNGTKTSGAEMTRNQRNMTVRATQQRKEALERAVQ